MSLDVRWQQRLSNFNLALNGLSEAVNLNKERPLSKLEEQGLIQVFEYNYELAWNVIKDFYEAQAEVGIQGSRDAIRMAFKRGLIDNGSLWMEMIKSRVLTSHTYSRETAAKISAQIINEYYDAFVLLNTKLNDLQTKDQSLL
ncbi:nucleotidyltransferase substrate binding protein [Colwellia sp. MB3u-4]|uniref:nucleotidyltransferase substrate binding protein n=1 Tax=Colwellia sp. MB3u-4 TaxID=2759822 RepID=UPI0015F5548B|nr:nucleotidyltransferase substrate binding protein [Colwellia sp. MB3u-4]MBA6288668.1 nucleotidyltransferase substrate binding protein [Colwellia sp. MB3u-4]